MGPWIKLDVFCQIVSKGLKKVKKFKNVSVKDLLQLLDGNVCIKF